MAQAGLKLTTSCLSEWSAFCLTDSCFSSVEIRIYKNKPLFIYGARSLLSCCTVIDGLELMSLPLNLSQNLTNSWLYFICPKLKVSCDNQLEYENFIYGVNFQKTKGIELLKIHCTVRP